MTLFFSGAVATMMAGREVRVSTGVKFNFASSTMWVWQGRGAFLDPQGNTWQGLGEFATISGVQGSSMLSTEPVTMTLSGIDPTLMATVRNQSAELVGRTCGVYFLTFDANWDLLDAPYLAELYLMDKATLSVDGESRTMVVTLSAEPLFFSKHVPPVAMMTDADQQRRYPGDTIFQRVGLLAGKQTVYWKW